MTSISAIGAPYQRLTPSEMLQTQLTSEIAAGTINATDQSALSAALDNIDSALSSERANATRGAKPPSPDEMKAKIESLIAGEVSDGKLTSAQADELKALFANTFSGRGRGGPEGPGGPGGAGGPGKPGAGAEGAQSSSDAQTSDTTATEVEELLKQFLKSLQETLSQSASYGANGQTRSITAALMIDYQT